MFRLTVVMFMLAATVITGALMIAVLASPALANIKMAFPAAAGLGILIAIPVAYAVAKAILGQSRSA